MCAGGELQQVVRFLRQEKEVASVELRLAQHELARLRSELAIAQRAVLEANAQVCIHNVAGWTCRNSRCLCLPRSGKYLPGRSPERLTEVILQKHWSFLFCLQRSAGRLRSE